MTTTNISSKKRASRSRRVQEPLDSADSDSPDLQLDSDALDDESEPAPKRKRPSKQKGRQSQARKKAKKADSEEDVSDDNNDKADVQVVGKLVKAPTTGRVPPGQISQNTFNFLTELTDPAKNDRKWFKLHEAVFRLAEKEWRDFVEELVPLVAEVDPQVPPLPPKDLIHRIYNDIRFKSDKTPYKTCLSATMSRSGRKGHFAGYHVILTGYLIIGVPYGSNSMIKPGGNSIIAGGAWQPAKAQLDFIRANIKRNSSRLRNIISDPTFVSYFGKPEPDLKGKRQSIFGRDDELKVAPKGVAKDHPDIDLLKCRSFVVYHYFTDEEVLSPDFRYQLKKVAEAIKPFIHCLNDMMSVIPEGTSDGEESGDEEATEDE